jgi:hypothetical protein
MLQQSAGLADPWKSIRNGLGALTGGYIDDALAFIEVSLLQPVADRAPLALELATPAGPRRRREPVPQCAGCGTSLDMSGRFRH